MVPLGRPQLPNGLYLDIGCESSQTCTLTVFPSQLSDYLVCSGGINLFSYRAFEVIHETCLQQELIWVPVQVETMTSTYHYHGITPLLSYDVLDEMKSEIEWRIPGKLIRKIVKWRFKFAPQYDLFVATNNWIIVSETLKTALENKSLSGLNFSPLPT